MSHVAIAASEANSNIALIKYWGKLDCAGNYPAVPSLSLTLSGLTTATRIELDGNLEADEVHLDGKLTEGRPRDRIVRVIDQFRRTSGSRCFARILTHNAFPTAAGLASSASGFAALVTAANAVFATRHSAADLSAIAREASASAARSIFEGWSILEVGADSAVEIAPAHHWNVALLVAITASGKKAVGSTEAMNMTRDTSPYYQAWVDTAPKLFDDARAAVLDRDLPRLGVAMEQSTLMMHATMLASRPATIFFSPGTVSVMHRVAALRAEGTPCYFTMDAGPHVKVLCEAEHVERVRAAIERVEGVRELLVTRPGPAARLRSAK